MKYNYKILILIYLRDFKFWLLSILSMSFIDRPRTIDTKKQSLHVDHSFGTVPHVKFFNM